MVAAYSIGRERIRGKRWTGRENDETWYAHARAGPHPTSAHVWRVANRRPV